MAILLNFSICQSSDCSSLTFNELTGEYSSSNQTGWGSPNRDLSTATAAILTITTPSGGVYNIDLFATGNFPTDDITLDYDIDFTTIGLTTGSKLPDGIYTFLYTVTTIDMDITVVYTQTIQQAFYCQVKCCVLSMFKDLDVTCDCAKNDKIKAIDAWLMYKGLIFSSGAGCSANFNDTLAILQKLCLNKNCTNCKQL